MSSVEETRRFLQMLPVGFEFRPTDEQLVNHYLFCKIQGKESELKLQIRGNDSPIDIIPQVDDVCRFEPWELADRLTNHPVFSVSQTNDPEWYFFSIPQIKKPNGPHLNRETKEGNWKPTGQDRKIKCRATGTMIGTRKTLVFYRGHGSDSIRTPWIIHEYHSYMASLPGNTTYVLCRLKTNVPETNLYRISSDLPSIEAPPLTTTEVLDNSSAGSGIHQTGGPTNNINLGVTDMTNPPNHINWAAITSYFDDNVIFSQDFGRLCYDLGYGYVSGFDV